MRPGQAKRLRAVELSGMTGIPATEINTDQIRGLLPSLDWPHV
jgi:hypothetical protein